MPSSAIVHSMLRNSAGGSPRVSRGVAPQSSGRNDHGRLYCVAVTNLNRTILENRTQMKARTALLSLLMCLFAVAVYAADSPALGTWKLNEGEIEDRRRLSQEHNRGVCAGRADKFKLTTDGVNGKGDATHSEWIGKFDGKDYPVTGDPSVDTRAIKQAGQRKFDSDQQERRQGDRHRHQSKFQPTARAAR